MGYELIAPLYDGQLVPLQSLADLLAIEAAKDDCSVTESTEEAEYYSASTAAVEVIYLRYLLQSMGFAPKFWTPVYEDKNACIEWSNNIIGGRERAKHIDIRKHFAQKAGVQNGLLRLIRVDTSKQLADIFTIPSRGPPASRRFLAGNGRTRKGRRSSRGESESRWSGLIKSSHVGPYEG